MKTNTNQEFSVANSSSAVYTQLVTVGVLKNAGSNLTDIVTATTGSVFVAQSPEQFGYDSDGNLTNDGRWAYSWDAENRLIGTETVSGLPAEIPRQKLVFGYDAQSRRISKVVSNWTGSAWAETTNLRFVYDGWNLIAEIDGTNGLVRSYTWGLDLSGTPQRAGGIGGLLAVTTASNGTHFAAYDGNGNVAGLVNASTGAESARYEYGPFGELIAFIPHNSSFILSSNPFRFSTKYADAETDLLYYGYRYYQPSTGRWISRDPIEEKGGYGLLAFDGNDVVNHVDATGSRLTITHDASHNVRVQATVQYVIPCSCQPCHIPTPQQIQSYLEQVWTARAALRIPQIVTLNPLVWTTVDIPMTITTEVDIRYVFWGEPIDPDRHTFILTCKEGDRVDRSHADQLGGVRAWIYFNDHMYMYVYAHEFGHWLGLYDLYNNDPQSPHFGEPLQASFMGNIMADGTRVDAWQIRRIEVENRNQYNQGLPIARDQITYE